MSSVFSKPANGSKKTNQEDSMKIGIAATASPFDKKFFRKGVAVLEKLGFEVTFRKDIFARERYLAGGDRRRAEELIELIGQKDVDAIIFARGGYGSQRILPHLNLKSLKKNRKPLVGFSDLTPLLNFLNQKAGFPALYGPVVTQLGNNPSQRTLKNLKGYLKSGDTILNSELSIVSPDCKILKPGKAVGKLAGGCLSLIVSSIGTPYALDLKNKILFFEDTNEKTYAVDRMLTQLKNSGALKSVKGILIGTLAQRKDDPHSMDAMLKEFFKNFKGPVVLGFPAGHTNDFVSLPLGVEAVLDTQWLK